MENTRNRVNTTQGGPTRARPGERSEIANRRRSGTTSIAGTVGDFPKYELDPVIVTDTVYFAPAEVTTQVGERFSTPILFYNAGEHEIDRIDLWIHYNPELFDPVWINGAEIEPRLAAPLTRQVWRGRGYIHIEGRLNQPLTEPIQPLVTINWRAGATGTTAEIEIESPAGEENGIYDGDVNCLKLSRIGNEGVVAVRVRVVDPNLDDDRVIIEVVEGRDPYAPAHRESRGVHLALIPADERVYPSEVSTVDIVILNPDLVPFDELRIRIRYDPEAVEILDADTDNYITDGTNIFDGAFHQRMPFEHHGKNLVDPERGIIEYVMASGEGLRPYPSGTVARIVFRMKRDAGSTTLWFEGLDPFSNRYMSDVRAQGRSMLGPADGREAEGLHHTRVRVSPL